MKYLSRTLKTLYVFFLVIFEVPCSHLTLLTGLARRSGVS